MNQFQELTEKAQNDCETYEDFKRLIPVAWLNLKIQARENAIMKLKAKVRKLETKQTRDHMKFASKLFRFRMKF